MVQLTKTNRERPLIGDRRLPSKLGDIQPDHWLPEYTTDLLDLLNVRGLLTDLAPASQLTRGDMRGLNYHRGGAEEGRWA